MEVRPSRRRDSVDTMVSMLHLEPSPMESTDDLTLYSEGSLESSTSTLRSQGTGSTYKSNGTSGSLGLSSSGRGPIYYREYSLPSTLPMAILQTDTIS